MTFFSWDGSVFLVKYNHLAKSKKKKKTNEQHLSFSQVFI